jgi:phage replication O-like protein O
MNNKQRPLELQHDITKQFTKVSNDVLDTLLFSLTPTEFKIYIIIYRQTIGWNKTWDRICHKVLMKKLVISRSHLKRNLKSLIEKGLIEKREVVGNMNKYKIISTRININGGVREMNPPGSTQMNPPGSTQMNPLQKTITKDILLKDIAAAESALNQYELLPPQSVENFKGSEMLDKRNQTEIPKNWKPDDETVNALTSMHGVPMDFIDHQAVEFKLYWKSTGMKGFGWDAKFFKRCVSQWRIEGHTWNKQIVQKTKERSISDGLNDTSWVRGPGITTKDRPLEQDLLDTSWAED